MQQQCDSTSKTLKWKCGECDFRNFGLWLQKTERVAYKVDATALFVKTTYIVFENNADVFTNNAVASTFFAEVNKKRHHPERKRSGAGVESQ